MSISVLLVDDHTIVREGLRRIIEAEPDMRVVGEASTGMEAVEMAARFSPRITVMDINLGEIDGIEATWQITAANPRVKVIILSMHDSLAFVRRVVQAGAVGYLLKESAGAELIVAIRKVHAGGQYFSPKMADRLAEAIRDRSREEGGVEDPLARLSPRERLIYMLLVQGYANQDIAEDLHLSPKTVATYRHRILTKLGVSEVVGLVHIAMQHGLTTAQAERLRDRNQLAGEA